MKKERNERGLLRNYLPSQKHEYVKIRVQSCCWLCKKKSVINLNGAYSFTTRYWNQSICKSKHSMAIAFKHRLKTWGCSNYVEGVRKESGESLVPLKEHWTVQQGYTYRSPMKRLGHTSSTWLQEGLPVFKSSSSSLTVGVSIVDISGPSEFWRMILQPSS